MHIFIDPLKMHSNSVVVIKSMRDRGPGSGATRASVALLEPYRIEEQRAQVALETANEVG